jgi:hypothetical protein
MFNQIEIASSDWVCEQKSLLADAQLLLQNINSDLGVELQKFIHHLSSLDSKNNDLFFKDHIFHNWLNEIKTEVLSVYENNNYEADFEKLSGIIHLMNLSIAVLSQEEIQFNINPMFVSRFLLPVSGLHLITDSISKTSQNITCKYLPNTSSLYLEEKKFCLSQFQGFESIKIAHNNFDFFSDPSGDEYNIEYDNEIDLPVWVSTLEKAIEIIKTDKSSYDLVSNFASYLVPLKQKEVIKNLSFSVRNLPGVIFKNNELNPFLIGETLVHESDHQLFYAIEKFDNFWKDDIKLQKPIFLSPWRDDPRPLDGILRGLSSFARVSQYYSTAITAYGFTPKQLEQVGLMLLQRLRESEVALNTVLQSEQLSEFGNQYANEIQETLNAVNAIVEKFEQFERWNYAALETIKNHKENWQLINQENG